MPDKPPKQPIDLSAFETMRTALFYLLCTAQLSERNECSPLRWHEAKQVAVAALYRAGAEPDGENLIRPPLRVNDVVQIDPAHDPLFGGCFMCVTEPKSWGAQGYVPMGAKATHSGVLEQAYYRAPHKALVYVGRAEWSVKDEPDEEASGEGPSR